MPLFHVSNDYTTSDFLLTRPMCNGAHYSRLAGRRPVREQTPVDEGGDRLVCFEASHKVVRWCRLGRIKGSSAPPIHACVTCGASRDPTPRSKPSHSLPRLCLNQVLVSLSSVSFEIPQPLLHLP